MPVTAVDLFCGVGGLTHGLQLAGLPVIAGFDIENSCRFAYEHNNNSRFILRDVTQLTGEELRGYYDNNTIKVLVGCAPCQPFSTYSLRYNKHGKKDDKWRLLYYFANLVEEVLPEVVSMEHFLLRNAGVIIALKTSLRSRKKQFCFFVGCSTE